MKKNPNRIIENILLEKILGTNKLTILLKKMEIPKCMVQLLCQNTALFLKQINYLGVIQQI